MSKFRKRRKFFGRSVGAKALKEVRKLKKIVVRPEMKIRNTGTITEIVLDTGTIRFLCNVPQGDEQFARDGSAILIKSIEFRATIKEDPLATFTNFRFMIFFDRQQEPGFLPGFASLLEQTNVYSPMDSKEGLTRFTVLYDKVITLNNVSHHSQGFRWKKFGLRVKQRYFSDLVTSLSKNGLYLMLLSDRAVGVQPPTLVSSFRMNYYDS